MKAYLDDFSLHHADEDGLLRILEEFLRVCEEHGLFLSALKCKFFKKSLKWCGRIVCGD